MLNARCKQSKKVELCNDGRDDDCRYLSFLWWQQGGCSQMPLGMHPFEWACKTGNVDSFMRFIRLRRLPRIPEKASDRL
jgi:hypothetical protein